MSITLRDNGFNLLSSWSWDWKLTLSRVANKLSKTSLIKYGFVELVVILFTFNARCDYMIPSNITLIKNSFSLW